MNFYQRHLGDYARDAGFLTMLEHGAYTLLLDSYYANERPIPHDDRYRIARARSKAEKAAVDVVLRKFFSRVNENWCNARAEREIAQVLEKKRKASRSALARWDANAMRTHSEGNALQEPISYMSIETLDKTSSQSVRGGGPQAARVLVKRLLGEKK